MGGNRHLGLDFRWSHREALTKGLVLLVKQNQTGNRGKHSVLTKKWSLTEVVSLVKWSLSESLLYSSMLYYTSVMVSLLTIYTSSMVPMLTMHCLGLWLYSLLKVLYLNDGSYTKCVICWLSLL